MTSPRFAEKERQIVGSLWWRVPNREPLRKASAAPAEDPAPASIGAGAFAAAFAAAKRR